MRVLYRKGANEEVAADVYQWLTLVHIPEFRAAIGGFVCDPTIFSNGEFWEINLIVPQERLAAYIGSAAQQTISEEANRNGMDSVQRFMGVVVISDDGSPSGGHGPESHGGSPESERGFSGGERG